MSERDEAAFEAMVEAMTPEERQGALKVLRWVKSDWEDALRRMVWGTAVAVPITLAVLLLVVILGCAVSR